jgi:hypothetical protein
MAAQHVGEAPNANVGPRFTGGKKEVSTVHNPRWTRWAVPFFATAFVAGTVPLAHAGEMMDKPIMISGHVAASYGYNLTNQGQTNDLRLFNASANRFSFDAAKIGVMGEMGEKTHFGLDLYYGAIANAIASAGTDGDDDIDVAQAYVAGTCGMGNGLDWTLGKFGTLIGAESIDSPSNMFTSHTMQTDFMQPYTHTGLLLSYGFHEKFSMSLGVVNGNDKVVDNNKEKTLLYGLSFPVDPRFDFSINGTYGAEGTAAGVQTALIDVVANIMPTEAFSASVNVDVLSVENGTVNDSGMAEAATALGVAGGGRYQFHEAWGIGARADFVSDTDGAVFGNPSGAESFFGITATLDAKHNKNAMCRLELRLESADQDIFMDVDGMPTGNQITIGLETVHSF